MRIPLDGEASILYSFVGSLQIVGDRTRNVDLQFTESETSCVFVYLFLNFRFSPKRTVCLFFQRRGRSNLCRITRNFQPNRLQDFFWCNKYTSRQFYADLLCLFIFKFLFTNYNFSISSIYK